jgi:molybdopterin-containing oxidoreductase family iron-sulfur binding subunit
MGIDRRDFLKIAGISTVFGFGAKAAIDVLSPGELEASMGELPAGKGKRWSMVVDTHKVDDKLIDKCIEACHSIHNVPDLGSPKEEIKWIWKEDFDHTFPGQEHEYIGEKVKEKMLPLMCNHCTNPPCCRVCPTSSTWQTDEGVVMMDPHRCIGCRFCMAACPYGSRSFNWGDPRRVLENEELKKLNPDFPTNPDYPTRSMGVVEKCNFCAERLAKGELPACVEAADSVKKGALVFGNLFDSDSNVRELLRERYSIRRKPELGTSPNLFFVV